MTVKEVANLLRITPQTIYKMVEDARLPAIRVGKQWRFERQKIREWFESNGIAPAAERRVGLTAESVVGAGVPDEI